MKVIDLMILKYKNRPLPKKIRFDVCEWKLTKGGNDYIHYAVGTGDYTYLSLEYFWHKLDKEVEILEPAEELTLIEEIEEDKEIEEIEIIDKTDERMKFYNCTYNKETKEYEFELKDIEIDYLFKNFEGNKGNIYERLDKNFKEIEYYLKALANAVNELKKGK